MEGTQSRKGFSVFSFCLGLLIGAGIMYVILKPDNSFVLSTNINNKTEKTGLIIPPTDQSIITTSQEQQRNYDGWDTLLSKIQPTASLIFGKKKIVAGELSLSNIREIVDLNGDGSSEALIIVKESDSDILSHATILTKDSEGVMGIKIKTSSGQTSDLISTIGTDNKIDFDIKLLPDDKSFYTSDILRDDTGNTKSCAFAFYHWNDTTKVFEYSKLLSGIAKQDKCK